METTIMGYIRILGNTITSPIMENHMKRNMENEMEAGVV